MSDKAVLGEQSARSSDCNQFKGEKENWCDQSKGDEKELVGEVEQVTRG